jgi:hypothetical protein
MMAILRSSTSSTAGTSPTENSKLKTVMADRPAWKARPPGRFPFFDSAIPAGHRQTLSASATRISAVLADGRDGGERFLSNPFYAVLEKNRPLPRNQRAKQK